MTKSKIGRTVPNKRYFDRPFERVIEIVVTLLVGLYLVTIFDSVWIVVVMMTMCLIHNLVTRKLKYFPSFFEIVKPIHNPENNGLIGVIETETIRFDHNKAYVRFTIVNLDTEKITDKYLEVEMSEISQIWRIN